MRRSNHPARLFGAVAGRGIEAMSFDANFRETFDSGATRILNAAEITKAVQQRCAADGSDDPRFLFESRGLNRVVFIKQPRRASNDPFEDPEDVERRRRRAKKRGEATDEGRQISTMVYIPFDLDDIPGGGNAFDLGTKQAPAMLRESVGYDPEAGADKRDARVLSMLEALPSLDPFLLKDKLEGAGVDVDSTYFDITEEEFSAIKAYILRKFEPITEKVVGGKTEKSRQLSEQFIMKLWEGRDLDYLAPITQVFNIDPVRATDIYYAWKGLTYYEFNYKKDLKIFMRFADWLQTSSTPSHYVKPAELAEFRELTQKVLTKFATHLEESSRILRTYNRAYEELFVHGGDSKPFVGILQNSSDLFWRVSVANSAMNHAISVWRLKTVAKKRDRLLADELRPMMKTLEQVID